MLDKMLLTYKKETYSANARQYYQYCSAILSLLCTLGSILLFIELSKLKSLMNDI